MYEMVERVTANKEMYFRQKKRKEIKDGTIGEREKEKEVGERETIIS